MATNKTSILILDTGADVSLFKVDKIKLKQQVYKQNKINLTGITNNSVNTLAATFTNISFGNVSVNHKFHIIPKDIDIKADGILGRDFLTKHKCVIDYDHWLLNFNYEGITICHPIEDSIDDGFILPLRSEVVRRVKLNKLTEDSIVLANEIKPGIFCGNSLVSIDKQYVKFINTTDNNVFIANNSFKPLVDPVKNYTTKNKISKNSLKRQSKINEILKQIEYKNIPNYIISDLEKILIEYSDVFCTDDEQITTNNFYEQSIELKDNVPCYIPNYKQIYSQSNEIKNQVDKLLKNDIIEHSVSPYNSPILLVPKKIQIPAKNGG